MGNALTRMMASAVEGVRWPVWGGAHHGASKTLREVAGWHASRGSADTDLLHDLPELRYRGRDIRRNNGLAASIAGAYVDNIVGTGIRMCAMPDYLALGQTKDWADQWGAKWEGIYHEWWWSTACHAADTKTGDMLAEEVLLAKIDSGGSLTLPLWLPKRGDGFATKLKTVEIDRLSNPNDAPNTTLIRGGIRFDDDGMPLSYFIRNAHLGDDFQDSYNSKYTWEEIPRRTEWGRLRVIHDFDGDRADQTQGKPLFTAVLDQFKNIDRYQKYEIQAALMNACIWGAITTPLTPEAIKAMFEGDEEKYLKLRQDHAVGMKPGLLAALFPGDKLESFLPQRPNAQYGIFCENVENTIAMGSGVPYVLATKNFSKSNYSNTRAAINEAFRTYNRRRDRLGAGWLDRAAMLLLEEVVNDGRLDAPNFYQFPRAYQRCMWIGPPRGYVDKLKETQGDVLELDNDLTTVARLAAERGMHWKELYDQRATERQYAAMKGLPDNSAVRAANPVQQVPSDATPPASSYA